LQRVADQEAGIEMMLPTAVVSFEKYKPPFAHYTASGDIDAKVLLISQEGDENTLAGLYDIMQTLEIVPESGPRTLERRAFTLIGEGALSISHTQAWLKDGHVKGFTLIWPAGDEERRTRMLGEMQESFTRLDGVLDPAAGVASEPSIDLVAGLEVRKPKLSRSGFFVDRSGSVVTTADVARDCGKITIDEEYEAQVTTLNEDLGIAVLRPLDALAPMSVAAFQRAMPRLQADVAVAGYSYGGLLGAPTLTFGQIAELQGLNGEDTLKRLALAALEGDAGGPVVDAGGAVLGMLLPNRSKTRKLPEGVSFAADAEAVQTVLQKAGVSPSATSDQKQIAPEALTDRAAGMTVLVSCWE
jgi:S1-C subfamily serine protease